MGYGPEPAAKQLQRLVDWLDENETCRDGILVSRLGGAKGVRAFAKALARNTGLKSLCFCEEIGVEEAEALAGALEKNAGLISLTLLDNEMSSEEAEIIATALAKNKTLKKLSISGSIIGRVGGKAILDAVQQNTSLIEVSLFRCGVPEVLVEQIQKKVAANRELAEMQAKLAKAGKHSKVDITKRRAEKAADYPRRAKLGAALSALRTSDAPSKERKHAHEAISKLLKKKSAVHE